MKELNASEHPKLKQVYELALDEIKKVLTGEQMSEVTRVAMTAMSNYTKQRATDVHANTLAYSVCKDFAKDGEELKSLLTNTMPKLAPVKLLKDKSK